MFVKALGTHNENIKMENIELFTIKERLYTLLLVFGWLYPSYRF